MFISSGYWRPAFHPAWTHLHSFWQWPLHLATRTSHCPHWGLITACVFSLCFSDKWRQALFPMCIAFFVVPIQFVCPYSNWTVGREASGACVSCLCLLPFCMVLLSYQGAETQEGKRTAHYQRQLGRAVSFPETVPHKLLHTFSSLPAPSF